MPTTRSRLCAVITRRSSGTMTFSGRPAFNRIEIVSG
jgi:hypothetical protein